MLKSGSRLTLLTFGSRILGLVREMTRASFLGTTALSDAWTVAFAIPNLLRKLFAENSVSVAFIPTFKQYLDSRTKEETRDFLSATFTFLSFASTLAVIIGMILTPFIVPFFRNENAGIDISHANDVSLSRRHLDSGPFPGHTEQRKNLLPVRVHAHPV